MRNPSSPRPLLANGIFRWDFGLVKATAAIAMTETSVSAEVEEMNAVLEEVLAVGAMVGVADVAALSGERESVAVPISVLDSVMLVRRVPVSSATILVVVVDLVDSRKLYL